MVKYMDALTFLFISTTLKNLEYTHNFPITIVLLASWSVNYIMMPPNRTLGVGNALALLVLFAIWSAVLCFFFAKTTISTHHSIFTNKKHQHTLAGLLAEFEKKSSAISTDLLLAIKEQSLESFLHHFPYHLFPKPKHSKTLQVYSKKAWQEFYTMITTGNSFSFCANGGSATAGAGLKQPRSQFFYQFVHILASTGVTSPDVNWKVIPHMATELAIRCTAQ